MAVAYVEYCNLERGTRWSELRRSHGYERPHNVRYWCLGNEMDGPWQIGQLQAREYGRKARDAAKQMRVIDPDLQLIACGSSGTFMPTYLAWDREVLEECYDQVDGISLHAYYGNTKAVVGQQHGALPGDESRHGSPHSRGCRGLRLRAGAAAIEQAAVAVVRRMERLVPRARRAGDATASAHAAPPLLEEVYNLEDALLVGGFVNTLLRNSDRVRVGLPRAAGQRHRAARDQRDRRAAAEHLLPVQLGAPLRARPRARSARRVGDLSASPRPDCRPISRATASVPFVDLVATHR